MHLTAGIVALLAVAGISAQDTWAIYTSQAVTGKNSMRGGSIELSLRSDSPGESRVSILADDSRYLYGVEVKNEGRSALGYRAKFTVEGDTDFCETLFLIAKIAEKEVYNGRLVDFEYTSKDSLERHQTDTWQFSIKMSESVSAFDELLNCSMRLHLDAWQNRFLALGMGWYDGADSEIFTLGVEPSKDAILESEEQTLPVPISDIQLIDEAITIPKDVPVSVTEFIPDDAAATSSGTMVEAEVLSEVEAAVIE